MKGPISRKGEGTHGGANINLKTLVVLVLGQDGIGIPK
jgi:hypothetical protein